MVVADMPFLSFHLSPEETKRNAGGFLQRGADAVKLEGGAKRVEMARALVDCEIPVMAIEQILRPRGPTAACAP